MAYANAKPKDVAEAHAPARVGVRTEGHAASTRPSRAPHRRALIVDGDPASARLCRETLERMGFVIERVDSGVAALVAARERAPDLILMDSQLRDVSAGETIGWLRSNQALMSVPIIVLGIADESRSARKGIRSLAKPLSSAAIERAVRDLCA